jgi:hypothetical protein
MGIGSQSLGGQDKTDFEAKLEDASAAERKALDKKLARITKDAITSAGPVAAAKVRGEIARLIKSRIL